MFKFIVALSVVVGASSAFAYDSQCTLSSDGANVAQGTGRVSATTVTGDKYVCASTYNGSSVVSITLSNNSIPVAKSSNVHAASVTTCVSDQGQPVVITCACTMPSAIGM